MTQKPFIDAALIERVAIALAKEYGDSEPYHYWARMAKAAISAMGNTRATPSYSGLIEKLEACTPYFDDQACERWIPVTIAIANIIYRGFNSETMGWSEALGKAKEIQELTMGDESIRKDESRIKTVDLADGLSPSPAKPHPHTTGDLKVRGGCACTMIHNGECQSSEICVITPDKLYELMTFSGHPRYLYNPLSDSQKFVLSDALSVLRPYLRTTEQDDSRVIECQRQANDLLNARNRTIEALEDQIYRLKQQPEPVSVTHDETLDKLAREYHRRMQNHKHSSLPDWDSDREDNKQWCRERVIEEWFPILAVAGVKHV